MLTRDSVKIPRSWEIVAGGDTGTYMGGAIGAISPRYDLYILEEFPNYRYTGDGTIELIGMTVGEWMKWFALSLRRWTGQRKNAAWVDANTTFKTEIAHGLRFRMNHKDLELRTEITREYLRHGRLFFMPWLEVIPFEAEGCRYPDHESIGSGKLKRLKEKDHCWDGVEHICSRRPHPDFAARLTKAKTGIHGLVEQYQNRPNVQKLDPHLGSL